MECFRIKFHTFSSEQERVLSGHLNWTVLCNSRKLAFQRSYAKGKTNETEMS